MGNCGLERGIVPDIILTINLSKEDLQALNDGKTVVYGNGKVIIKHDNEV